MDPRLIQLMQQLQQSRQPVRFDDGGEVGEDGEDLSWLFGGGNNYGDIDPGWFGGDVQDYSETVNPEDILGSEVINNLIGNEEIDTGWGGGPSDQGGYSDTEEYQLGGEPSRAAQNLDSLLQDIEEQQASEAIGDKALSEMEVPQYDETLSPYKDIYDAYMQGASLDSEGKFNAARDSQAANEYLERVMGVPRSEIDAAYASAMPRFVNLSNFQGGKSFETGVDRYGNPIGTPGREVKYDKNGNIVDAKTGTVIEKAPAGTTSKAIQDILRQYTGGGTGTGSSNNMSWLLPLLLMMMAMNRNQQPSGQAVIPKLSAERSTLPYGEAMRAPGYRPGQGGVQYVSDVQYKPMAAGGIAALAGGGKGLLHGPGDGVSDSIPAMIGSDQPARLARGEYVVDARTVAELGNGSTDAGAERLDEMRQRVLSKRKQAKMGQDTKAYRHLPA